MLLHHEVEVEYPETGVREMHKATLLEFGKTEKGKTVTAMALTVGIPAATGALASVSFRGSILPFPDLPKNEKKRKASSTTQVYPASAALAPRQDQDERRPETHRTRSVHAR